VNLGDSADAIVNAVAKNSHITLLDLSSKLIALNIVFSYNFFTIDNQIRNITPFVILLESNSILQQLKIGCM
jgi:hypothetical protein